MGPKLDLDSLCRLACLRISAEEKGALEERLRAVIEWIDTLKECPPVEWSGNHVLPDEPGLPFREDIVRPSLPSEKALSQSTRKTGNFFRVPRTIK